MRFGAHSDRRFGQRRFNAEQSANNARSCVRSTSRKFAMGRGSTGVGKVASPKRGRGGGVSRGPAAPPRQASDETSRGDLRDGDAGDSRWPEGAADGERLALRKRGEKRNKSFSRRSGDRGKGDTTRRGRDAPGRFAGWSRSRCGDLDVRAKWSEKELSRSRRDVPDLDSSLRSEGARKGGAYLSLSAGPVIVSREGEPRAREGEAVAQNSLEEPESSAEAHGGEGRSE